MPHPRGGISLAPPRNDRRTIAAWCLYDWANSAFTTLVVTFVYATYFTRAIAPDEIAGTALWSRGVTVTALLVALASPVLGALADVGGMRRRLLVLSTVACVAATAALTFVAPGTPNAILLALTLFVVANVGFELGNVFCFAWLPDLVTADRIGRVSGYGWGAGYVGGLFCLVVALVGFVQPEQPWFGLTRAEGFNVRATNLLVAAWFAVFSLPFLLRARDDGPAARPDITAAFRELGRTFREVRRFREAAKFLFARLFYNDAVTTIFAFGGIYAAGTFGMTFAEILVFGIVINVAAGLGALLFGFVDDRIGGKRTVLVSVAGLTAATALAAVSPNRAGLWVAALLIGVFAGPNQAASRSLMGRFAPPGRESEFYGFFAVSGKLASFAGPLLLGVVTQAAHSQRAGVATIVAFFLAGGLLLFAVDEAGGMAAARAARGPGPPTE